MTLQQMEYIVALDKYRHFVLAAEACGVTQPTLSAMIQKLEEELDVKIFNRDRKNITPTRIGEKIIRQAQIVLNETQCIKEVVADETDSMNGNLRIGILPTIAPYLVPDFIHHSRTDAGKASVFRFHQITALKE
ncbi:LysR family transcriptional regulator [Phocaeicola plebeius]|uniref:LysR family transcriptional regulator n=1 Tax=Phocaeicola plebeius TaxID=310297 RepID=UPI00266CEA53|nr:LysR family transcriptional regulator [Phocaeicola plebeius]